MSLLNLLTRSYNCSSCTTHNVQKVRYLFQRSYHPLRVFPSSCQINQSKLVSNLKIISSYRLFTTQSQRVYSVKTASKTASSPPGQAVNTKIKKAKSESKAAEISTIESRKATKLILPPVESEWKTIYRFNHILGARVFQRFKIYQTIFTGAFLLPTTVGCYLHQLVDLSALGNAVLGSVATCGILYVVGQFFSRLIGLIYVSNVDPDEIRVAHLSFWGSRVDVFCHKDDFVKLCDLPDEPNRVYIKLRQYSEDEEHTFNLSLRHGTIIEREDFENIFGFVPDNVG